MPNREDIRRLAMQVLYQIDLRGQVDRQAIVADGPDRQKVCEAAFDLAEGAWANRLEADRAAGQLAPDWPTHRQPPLDRAILRLAHFEMTSGHAPVKVAINEAVNLAKQFCAAESPPFINGVLDKMARGLESTRA